MREQNVESLENMKENLISNNLKPDDIPLVLQYNKRDLKNILSVEEIDRDINPNGDRIIEAAAIDGTGVEETFRLITSRLLKYISAKHNVKIDSLAGEEMLSEPPTAQKPLPKEPPAAEDFVIERTGVKETVVQPAAPEPFESGGPLTEAEIEESIMKTSFPEAPAEIFEVPEIPDTSEIPDISEFPGAPEIPDISEFSEELEAPEVSTKGQAPEASDILMMVLEELRESRKQQSEILKALQKLMKKS
jgi:hypothetical protein